jgi:hypothetical protein
MTPLNREMNRTVHLRDRIQRRLHPDSGVLRSAYGRTSWMSCRSYGHRQYSLGATPTTLRNIALNALGLS